MRRFALVALVLVLCACGQKEPSPVPTAVATMAPATATHTAQPTAQPATPVPVATTTPPTPVAESLPVVTLPATPVVGIYDPARIFDEQSSMQVEMVYQPWRLNDAMEIVSEVHRIREANRFPLVTIEPWPFNWSGLVTDTLFLDIKEGRYDSSIQAICAALNDEAPQEVWVRWGHEMELEKMFVWSQGNPKGFISAYRHFVNTCRESAPNGNIRFIWSPAGAPNLVEFWPGSEYVDLIGLTVLGFREWDLANGAKEPLGFEKLFGMKYNLVKQYGKPILANELGVAGNSKEYQTNWLRTGFESFNKFPLLRGVIYFNMVNPRNSWGQFKAPDWRVTPDQFPPH